MAGLLKQQAEATLTSQSLRDEVQINHAAASQVAAGWGEANRNMSATITNVIANDGDAQKASCQA